MIVGRSGVWWRLRGAGVVVVVLVAVAGCAGSPEDLAELEGQVARVDEAMRGVGSRLEELGAKATGPGRGIYGECGLSPSTRVGYTARVSWRGLPVSDDKVVAEVKGVLESLGWTVRISPGYGLTAERGPVGVNLRTEGLGAALSVETECLSVPDAVEERPDTTFGFVEMGRS